MRDARIKPRRPEALSARELLARWLVRGRMTQGEGADQIGISRVKLNQYLNGEARPSLETAIRIEDATGIGARIWLIEDAADPVVSDGDPVAPVLVQAARLTE
jgi:transcriptional regulator with XRE-family HTH domain